MVNHHAHPGETTAALDPTPAPVAARLRAFQIADAERRGHGRGGRRRWLWLAVLAVHAGAGWLVYQRLAPEDSPEVETFTFTGKPPRDVRLDLSGFVVPRTRIVISTQVGGIVARVHLPGEGQKVKAGALLFEVEDTRYRAEYVQAQAALATAQAQLDELTNGSRPEEKRQAAARLEQAKAQAVLMEAELKRVRQLCTEKAAGRVELEKTYKGHVEAQAALKSEKASYELIQQGPRVERIAAARAEVDRARALYERAKFYYEKTRIYAPEDGSATEFTVLEKKVAPGESIQADLTYTPLCVLADLTHLEAEIDVQERDLGVLAIGAPCEIIPDAYPDRVYHGRVARRQPVVNRQRGVVPVKVAIDDPDEHLLPDMNARVLLLGETKSPAADALPEIPVRALVPGSESPAVFVLEGDTAHRRPVELGSVSGDAVQVRGGLRPGERVLVPLGRTPVDGRPVSVRGESKRNDEARREKS